MSLSPMICEDCNYPPNWIVVPLAKRDEKFFSLVKCRDCGDEWEEPEDSGVYIDEEKENDDDFGPFDNVQKVF